MADALAPLSGGVGGGELRVMLIRGGGAGDGRAGAGAGCAEAPAGVCVRAGAVLEAGLESGTDGVLVDAGVGSCVASRAIADARVVDEETVPSNTLPLTKGELPVSGLLAFAPAPASGTV